MTLKGFDVGVFLAFIAAFILLSMVKSRREKNSVVICFLPQFLRAESYEAPERFRPPPKSILLNVEV
jgi:hypothetical protein